jgi:hypothetical protein
MKRCLFVGHNYHKTTLSSNFFIKLLKKKYIVDYFWTTPFMVSIDIQNIKDLNREYDIIIFWQTMPSVNILKDLQHKNIILIPMYDNDLNITYNNWREYNEYKFILFSKHLYNKLTFLGNKNLLYLQYAPKIIKHKSKNITKKPKVFFWQRKKYMDFEFIKKILDFKQIDSIHIHMMKNEFSYPSKKDIEKYNITFSSWFETKNEMYDFLKSYDVFIAPRFYEGIGMSFLEAMAMGKCVIASNLPTMNEYIKDKKNGLLFDPIEPKKVNLKNYKKIGKNAKKTIKKIYKQWKKEKKNIYDFIEKKPKKSNLKKINLKLDKKLDFINDDFNSLFPKTPQSKIFTWYLNALNIFLKRFVLDNQKVILYGAGTGAYVVLDIIKDNIEFIVDMNKNKQGTTLKTKKIKSLEALYDNDYPILISVFERAQKIKKFLIENKIDSNRIISLDINSYGF